MTAEKGKFMKKNAAAIGSPEALSGDAVQVPVHIPVNLRGNNIDVVGLLNEASDNVRVSD
ncbi:chaplin [Streptomyces sp. MH13]|uniref:chaplin n=1 Tax=Streptomyces sp. MH13 TaxID=3417651 RepID=UPI003CE692B7